VRVNPEDFEHRYRDAADADPWSFATSPYEQRRYDLAVRCLDRPRYASAFEPGCAIGELTRRLAVLCDRVVALDPSPTALQAARQRVGHLDHVELRLGAVPEGWPDERFELVVLSELGYYFDPSALRDLAARAVDAAAGGGQLLAVHWRGHSDDHVLHGDTVHAILEDVVGRAPEVRLTDPGFLCARWDLA
jgi:SAM-dependent methyltransferase